MCAVPGLCTSLMVHGPMSPDMKECWTLPSCEKLKRCCIENGVRVVWWEQQFSIPPPPSNTQIYQHFLIVTHSCCFMYIQYKQWYTYNIIHGIEGNLLMHNVTQCMRRTAGQTNRRRGRMKYLPPSSPLLSTHPVSFIFYIKNFCTHRRPLRGSCFERKCLFQSPFLDLAQNNQVLESQNSSGGIE